MEKPVEHDPQQYSEEWFNVAILLGKEFELPNISNPPFTDKTNNAVPKNKFDVNESIANGDQTDVWTNHFLPSKKAKLDSNHESNSVQEREIVVDLNNIAPECNIEDGEYKCFICSASYTNGNALGGHMSSHAKQRKREAIAFGNFFKPGSFSGFGESNNFFAQVSDMFVVESAGIEGVDEEKSTHSDSEEL